jgi:hypothetical protein
MALGVPLDRLSFKAIQEFCEGRIPEGSVLDYKQEIASSTLSKTACAFANTFGGEIIIGVKDDDGVPVVPAEGMAHEEGLSTKVINILLSNIYPPLIPEVQTFVSDDKSKAFVVVRIAPSLLTPHAVNNNTNVYIRTGDRNSPEQIADLGRVAWLLDRRKRSEQLKLQLVQETKTRFSESVKLLRLPRSSQAEFHLLAVPAFPTEPILDASALTTAFIQRTNAQGYTKLSIPGAYPTEHQRRIRDGLLSLYHNQETGWWSWCETNSYGLRHFVAELRRRDNASPPRISFGDVLAFFDVFLDSITKFWKAASYCGVCEVWAELEGIRNFRMGRYPPEQDNAGVNWALFSEQACLDTSWSANWSKPIQGYDTERREVLSEFAQSLGGAFNVQRRNLEADIDEVLREK